MSVLVFEYIENIGEEIINIFRGVLYPEISLSKSKKLIVPENLSVQIGGSSLMLKLLAHPEAFHSKNIKFKKAVLDILYIILRKSIYNVIRFQCFEEMKDVASNEPVSLVRLFLNLLSTTTDGHEYYAVTKRIIRLFGVIVSSGITTTELKLILRQLHPQSDVNVCWLQAIKVLMKKDAVVAKASPKQFFNFGGIKSGLYSVLMPFPFTKEYQVFTWFRIESFLDLKSGDMVQKSALSASFQSSYHSSQSVICISSSEYIIDICIENRFLTIKLLSNKGPLESTILPIKSFPETSGGLRRGVWYHVCVRHSQSRYGSFFRGNDELAVHLDMKQVYQGSVKYPSFTKKSLCEFSIGRNFDGQVTPVYFCSESIPMSVVSTIAQVDAEKENDMDVGTGISHLDINSKYLNQHKFLTCYHPNRVACGHAIDIHSGRHARIGPSVFVSTIVSARDVLESIGGVISLFPLFPSLLIEGHEDDNIFDAPKDADVNGSSNAVEASSWDKLPKKQEVVAVPNKSSHGRHQSPSKKHTAYRYTLRDLLRDSIDDELLDEHILRSIESSEIDLEEENYLTLLLCILSRCVENHAGYKSQLLQFGGIEMIEYVMLYNAEMNAFEIDSSCVREILHLRSLVKDVPELEIKITKHILCNFNIWSRSMYDIQCSIESIIMDDIRARPEVYAMLLGGVSNFLSIIDANYLDSENIVRYDPSTAPNSMRSSRIDSNAWQEDPELVTLRLPPKSFISAKESMPSSTAANNHSNDPEELHSFYSSHGGDIDEEDVSVFISEETSHHGDSTAIPKMPQSTLNAFPAFNVTPVIEEMVPVFSPVLTKHVEAMPEVPGPSEEFSSQIVPDSEKSQRRPSSHKPLLRSRSFTFELPVASSPTVSSLLFRMDSHRGNSIPSSPIEDAKQPTTPRSTNTRPKLKFKQSVKLIMRKYKSGEDGYESNTDEGSIASDVSQTLPTSISASTAIQYLDLPETPRTALMSPSSTCKSQHIGRSFSFGEYIHDAVTVAASADTGAINGVELVESVDSSHGGPEDMKGELQNDDATARIVKFQQCEPLSPISGKNNESASDKSSISPQLNATNSTHDLFLGCFTPGTSRSMKTDDSSERAIASFLSRKQRHYLRSGLRAIIMTIIHQSIAGPDQLKPLLSYMIFCRDTMVLQEISNMILNLLVEGADKHYTAITEEFSGPEEFASCIMLKLVNNSSEQIRCIGIRILSLYFLRLKGISLPSTKPRDDKKNELIRLQLCGGISLLSEILGTFTDNMTLRMYAALLEMLLIKTDMIIQGQIEVNKVKEPQAHSQFSQGVLATPISNTISLTSSTPSTSRVFDFANASSFAIPEDVPIQFVDHYLRQSQLNDEEDPDMINSSVLPLYLTLLPRFPMIVKQQAVSDLLSLLKHSAGNRSAFCQQLLWHRCLFILLSEFIESNSTSAEYSHLVRNPIHATEFMLELDKYSMKSIQDNVEDAAGGMISTDIPVAKMSASMSNKALHYPSKLSIDITAAPKHKSASSAPTTTAGIAAVEGSDLWYSVGMKIYTTLLLHELQRKDGWISVVIAMSQGWPVGSVDTSEPTLAKLSLSNSQKSSVASSPCIRKSSLMFSTTAAQFDLQDTDGVPDRYTSNCIMSNLLNDCTFMIRKTYYELRSRHQSDKLANILSVIIFTANYALAGRSVATHPLPNLSEMKRRQKLYAEMRGSSSSKGKDDNKKHVYSPNSNSEIFDRVEELVALNYLATSCLPKDPARQDSDSRDSSNSIDLHHMFVDFSHTWFSLPSMQPHGTFSSEGNADINASQIFSEDSLVSLDLDANNDDASLVIVLQNLRLFDSLFWVEESQPFRNSLWLKYVKPKPKSSRHSAHNENSNWLNSVYVSVLRQSLFVLNVLNPMHELATLNLFRIRNLIAIARSNADIPRKSIPVKNLIVVIFAHVILSLQRIVVGLAPIFAILGLPTQKLRVPVSGRAPQDELFQFEFEYNSEAKLFESLVSKVNIIDELNNLFGNLPGENLLRYIKASLVILLTLVSEHWACEILKDVYQSDFTFVIEFVERMNQIRPISARKTSSRISSDTAHESCLPLPNDDDVADDVIHSFAERSKSDAESVTSSSFGSTISSSTSNANLQALSEAALRAVDDQVSSLSVLQAPPSTTPIDRTGASENGPPVDRDTNRTPPPFAHISAKSNSLQGGSNFSTPTVPPLQFTPQSHSLLSSPQSDPLQLESGRTGDGLMSLDMITILRFLRDPFFRFYNCCLTENTVNTILAFEEEELLSASVTNREMESFSTQLNNTFQENNCLSTAGKTLQDLSTMVLVDLSMKERVRMNPVRHSQEIHIRQAAQCWDSCNQLFDTVWSPYYEDSGDNILQLTTTTAELAGKCDSKLIRMILTQSHEQCDHSQEAYLISRSMIEPGGDDNDPKEISKSSHKQRWLKSSLSNHSMKYSTAGWDIEDDDVDNGQAAVVSNSSTASSTTAGGMATNNNSGGIAEQEAVVSRNIWQGGTEILGIDFSKLIAGMGSGEDKKPSWVKDDLKSDEKPLFSSSAELLQTIKSISVEVFVTTKALFIHTGDDSTDMKWELEWLEDIYARRHLQKVRSAVLYFIDSSELLLIFPKPATLRKFFKCIRLYAKYLRFQSTTASFRSDLVRPEVVMHDSPWTEKWCKWQISNYDYLMRLNIVSGRSFHDLSQYPVFPWVLADYSSPNLDLTNPQTYRDLSKPMGAQDSTRLEYFLERYHSFTEEDDKFLYGSHYSTEGYVLYYLLRQEPFTSLGIRLQGGRFDCPDRLFIDIGKTWESCSSQNHADVKELIPEFFTCPEILLNTNNLPLGTIQGGNQPVHDVALPPWAATAFDFIHLHREALESEYVSTHLHEWIDLIFGYKQTGSNALESYNLFRSLTYEDRVDVDAIGDEKLRKAVEDEILYYGQTPSLLFSKPHPKRKPREECVIPLFADVTVAAVSRIVITTPSKQLASITDSSTFTGGGKTTVFPAIAVQSCGDRLIVVHSDYTVAHYKWNLMADADGTPFQVKFDKERTLPSIPHAMSPDVLEVQSFVPLAPASATSNSSMSRNTLANSRPPIPSISPHVRTAATPPFSETTLSPLASNSTSKSGRRKSQMYSLDSIKVFGQQSEPRHISVEEEVEVLLRLPGGGRERTESHGSDGQSTSSEPRSTTSTSSLSNPSQLSSSQATVLNSMVVGHTTDVVIETKAPRKLSIFESIKKGLTDSVSKLNSGPATTPVVDSTIAGNADIAGMGRNASDTLSTLSGAEKSLFSPRNNIILDDHLFDAEANLASHLFEPSLGAALRSYASHNISLHVGSENFGKLVSCGYWDDSFRVHNVDSMKELATSGGCSGAVTCLKLAKLQNGFILLTGSADGICKLWVMDNPRLASALSKANANQKNISNDNAKSAVNDNESTLTFIHNLLGHQSAITALSYNSELDALLSGSADGTLCLHNVRKGLYIHSILTMRGSPVDHVVVTGAGYMAAYSTGANRLHLFWINGQPLVDVAVDNRVTAMVASCTSTSLVCGDVAGNITIRNLGDLSLLRVISLAMHGEVSSLWFTDDSQYLLIGSHDGHFSIASDPEIRGNALLAALQNMPLLGSTI